ncbi:MAG: multicopper oxidase family protein [Acidobacteriota bacterium]
MHLFLNSLAAVVAAIAMPAPVAAAGGACDPGAIAAPASFEGTIRPALAVDLNPDPDIVEVALTARESTWDFGLGVDVPVWNYNGVIPGPTLEAKVGDTLIVHLCNDLPMPTTIHWHGVETPANMDGSHISQLTVPPGGTFRYEFPLLRAGLYWYHPHVRTHVSVERGLYGLLLVRDPAEDQALGLPTREHLVVLDDVQVEPDNTIRDAFVGPRENVAMEMLNGREGNQMLLNGKVEPRILLEQRVPHRLRILNAASARFQRLSVPDHPFWRIGGDQGLIEEPILIEPAATAIGGAFHTLHPSDPDPTTGLLMTPGERADVIFFPIPEESTGSLHFEWHDTQRGRHSIDFNDDGTVALAHNVPDGTRSPIIYGLIDLFGDSTATSYEPPATLRTLEAIDPTGAARLQLTLGHTIPNWETGEVKAFIQTVGKPFAALTDADVYTLTSNRTYIWEVKNLTGSHHNFHTHGWSFQHLETEFVDLSDPDNPETNFIEPATHLEDKDTFLLRRRPGTVPGQSFSITRFVARLDDTGREGQVAAYGFDATAQRSGGWLAHCHILEHAALGMSTVFQVTDLFSDNFESGDFSAWSAVVVE